VSGLPFVLFVCCTELCLAAILGAGVMPLAGVIVGSCARRIGVGRGSKRGATSGAGLAAALVMGQWLQSVWSPGGPNKYLSGYEWRRLATQELPGVGRITTHEIYLAADRRHWNSMTGAHRPLLADQLVPFGLSLPPAEPGTKRWVVLVSWGGGWRSIRRLLARTQEQSAQSNALWMPHSSTATPSDRMGWPSATTANCRLTNGLSNSQ